MSLCNQMILVAVSGEDCQDFQAGRWWQYQSSRNHLDKQTGIWLPAFRSTLQIQGVASTKDRVTAGGFRRARIPALAGALGTDQKGLTSAPMQDHHKVRVTLRKHHNHQSNGGVETRC